MSGKSKNTKGKQKRVEKRKGAAAVSPPEAETSNAPPCFIKQVANSPEPKISSGINSKRESDEIIAYVQSLSPVKRNRKNTLDYSTLVLQTEESNMEALLYSKSKRQLLVDSANSHTPLKIQKYTKSVDGEKLIINDMTRISTPDQTEYAFQFKEIEDKRTKTVFLNEIFEANFKEWDIMAVRGKILHVTETKVVGTKRLKLASARLADTTGKIWLDLWEKQISEVVPSGVYLFTAVQIRIWSGEKKLTTTMDTTVTPIDDEDLSQITLPEGDEMSAFSKVINVAWIDIIKCVNVSLLCSNCSKKILQASATAIIRCDKCKCRMCVGSCTKQLAVHLIVTPSTGVTIELTIFQNILSQVLGNVPNMQEDEISESLLALEDIKITYDPSNNVITNMLVL